MSKRPPGGPDAELSRGEIAGYRHAPHNADHGGDAAGSDEVSHYHDSSTVERSVEPILGNAVKGPTCAGFKLKKVASTRVAETPQSSCT